MGSREAEVELALSRIWTPTKVGTRQDACILIQRMPECLLCLEDKPTLTDEHIIPAALGSNLTLPKSTCRECQTLCNSSFEQRFLKGSNFVSLLRAYLGIKGRRNEPIYGFDRHGNPLTMTVQQGFPRSGWE